MMKRFRTGLAGVGAGLVATACLAGTAAASTSVTAAIKAQDQAVKNSPVIARLKGLKGNNKATARKLAREFDTLAIRFEKSATVVSHASAMSSQTAGQHEWVDGVRLEATGLRQFSTGITDGLHGNKSAAKAELKRAAHTLVAADKLREKGDRALHLSIKD